VILFIDLDGFKGVNDEHGHRAGDSVLQAVAERATHALRGTDTVGRWGGDELLVLMEDTDRAMIEDLTERVRRALELPTSYQGTTIKVGASIGRAVFPDDGASFAELVRLADQRMYEDKQRRSGGER
jgi:diguanylate cyclase (GGDEF)-like protein